MFVSARVMPLLKFDIASPVSWNANTTAPGTLSIVCLTLCPKCLCVCVFLAVSPPWACAWLDVVVDHVVIDVKSAM